MRLGKRARKLWLVVHIASAGAWIGMDIVMGVLILAGMMTGGEVESVAYQALGLFAVWPMLVSGVVCLISGVVLGIGTKYGVVRYWWVAVKFVMNIVLCLAVWFALRPGVEAAAAQGGEMPSDLIFPPIVSTTALIIATVLSVFKPWGRVRRGA
jgi:hypothetical protein